MHRVSEAWIPTKLGKYKMITYSMSIDEKMPHVVMIHEDVDISKPVYVRIHSECMTGDLFGSLRCDCGEQLERSKEIIAEQHGILIYLRQEGRGIGLIKKLEAYNFQDDGADTVDANLMLGFHSDEREYTDAIEILKDLKIKEIILLTNNPDKLNAFDNTGIKLVKREPLIMDANSLNKRYIDTKKEKMGHLI